MKSLFVFAFAAIGAITQAQVADVTADFGAGATNPNGNWTYGYFATAFSDPFTPYTVNLADANDIVWRAPQSAGQLGTPAAWLHLGAPVNGVGTGQFALHPGPSEISVARFTVPVAWGSGSAAITGSFGQGDIGSVGGHILRNGVSLFSQPMNVTTPFSLSGIGLNAGDTIDFAVDNLDGFSFDSTPLDAHIEFASVPEPTSLAVLGLGMIALIRRRKA